MDFPDDGSLWIDFRYEGLPSYCLIYGKVGHVTKWCKAERLGDEASEVDMEALYAFKGLDAKYDLRGNWFLRRRDGQMGTRGKNGSSSSSSWRRNDNVDGGNLGGWRAMEIGEKEQQRLEWERAFDAGFIGP